jgi:hypothetical protein
MRRAKKWASWLNTRFKTQEIEGKVAPSAPKVTAGNYNLYGMA